MTTRGREAKAILGRSSATTVIHARMITADIDHRLRAGEGKFQVDSEPERSKIDGTLSGLESLTPIGKY